MAAGLLFGGRAVVQLFSKSCDFDSSSCMKGSRWKIAKSTVLKLSTSYRGLSGIVLICWTQFVKTLLDCSNIYT